MARIAELVKSPEHVHTYRITPLSLWNAASAGDSAESVLVRLEELSRFPIPASVRASIGDFAARYGKLILERTGRELCLKVQDATLYAKLAAMESLKEFLASRAEAGTFLVPELARGKLKHALIKFGYPVKDLAGYSAGASLTLRLRATTRAGMAFRLRDYQAEAVEAFLARDREGGSGVVTLPCGAGKTVVALAAMARLQVETLILATNIVALRQWRRELIDKLDVPEDMIGEYSSERKQIRPITLATYQIVTHKGSGDFPHFALFDQKDWGLIVYDEVHLLPAPIFQITALLQARRRLGLTATLVREDGQQDAVFSLIGPKKYDVPWKTLESKGWIAKAECFELRVPMPELACIDYAAAESFRTRFRLASENIIKEDVLGLLLSRHHEDLVLVIGQYLSQLRRVARRFDLPLLTGQSPTNERDRLFGEFREGKIRCLAVSSIANFALDLPDANCAIQISGNFGSRQEEAQRLGRILRPKAGGNSAVFYTLVTNETDELDFARHRQLFLAEQGYDYTLLSLPPGVQAEQLETLLTPEPALNAAAKPLVALIA
jgi:DNA excision repair protein ERCC-3